MSLTEKWKASAPYLLGFLRIVAAVMFIQSGTMKLFAWPIGMPPDNGTSELFTQIGIGGFLEAFGGFFLLIGLWTRPVAFLLSGLMAVAYWQFHFNMEEPWPIENGGGSAVLYCFLWLYYSAVGAGKWSLDSFRKKHKT